MGYQGDRSTKRSWPHPFPEHIPLHVFSCLPKSQKISRSCFFISDSFIHVERNHKKAMVTCSKPPSSSVVSMALFVARTWSLFPVNCDRICTMVDFPLDWPPTYQRQELYDLQPINDKNSMYKTNQEKVFIHQSSITLNLSVIRLRDHKTFNFKYILPKNTSTPCSKYHTQKSYMNKYV